MGLRTREPRPTQTEGKFISLKNEYKALIKKKQFNYPFARTVFPCPLPWFATTTRTALCFLAATVAGTTSHALPPIVIRPISLTSVSLSTATVVTVRLRKSKKNSKYVDFEGNRTTAHGLPINCILEIAYPGALTRNVTLFPVVLPWKIVTTINRDG